MQPIYNVQPMHSYRATLYPPGAHLSDVEDLADAKLLPTIRLKAATAEQAEANAHITTGKNVLRVERVEESRGAER
ncbi:hypothetical protein CLU86_0649 [Acidovorax sp. 62]|uniref:hypothetical protein n=1 Tax=Acidovorax sp. 62 TaxID=2035203 RepID=UPI000C18E511|nr:hypothetical protein [Acidovorax sp. 62]PIF89772.1 hypothetical protein CLU86_0649 [Acidovorax sp. 62]